MPRWQGGSPHLDVPGRFSEFGCNQRDGIRRGQGLGILQHRDVKSWALFMIILWESMSCCGRKHVIVLCNRALEHVHSNGRASSISSDPCSNAT